MNISLLARRESRLTWGTALPLFLASLLLLLVAGCGKEEPPPGPPAAGVAAREDNAVTPAVAAPPAPVAALPPAGIPVDLDSLTQAVRRYSAEKRRVPANLSEVVAAGYLKGLPQAPPGKKFAINPKRAEVTLVNR